MGKRIIYFFIASLLLPMLTSCDDGTDVLNGRPVTIGGMQYRAYICDQQGENLIYWNSKFKNPGVKFDPHLYRG